MPLFCDCLEDTSTAYWSSGGGLTTDPPAVESGTLNWITCRLDVEQCPAVPRQCLQSSKIQAEQPMGIARPERGSLESTRSSIGPHWLLLLPIPTQARPSATRLGPIP